MKVFYCLLTFSILFLIGAYPAFAQVVVNEVHPAPTAGNDWIELYNASTQDLSLTGWTLQDSSSSLTTSPLLTNQMISSHGFFIVEVSNRLNNTSDQVKLFNPTAELVDLLSYDHTVTDQSWSRELDGLGSFKLASATRGTSNSAATPLPTPSPTATPSASPFSSPTPTTVPTPAPTPSPNLPSHIVVSEIMACPNTNESEWVELQNLDDAAYPLTNWQLRDSQNNIRYFSSSIAAQGLVVIQISPGMLNNTGGDQLSVIRPDGVTTNWASYLSCTKGKSLVFDGQKWTTADPTPGMANPDVNEDSSTNPTLDSASDEDDPLPSSEPFSPQSATSLASSAATLPVLAASADANDTFTSPEIYAAATTPPKQQSSNSTHLTSATSQLSPLFVIGGSTLLLLSSALLFGAWYTEKSEIKTAVLE